MNKSQILKDLIELSGLSKKKFADKHEISPQQLSDWTKGRRNIMFCTLELIAFDEGFDIIINYKIEKNGI
jgi:transcriptional regulator with XRE-family HTH domain